jgi:hypothetical protein
MGLLHQLGLRETYRREHPGQGTANVCFAFENMFLELLWITNPAEATSAAIARTRLLERSQWRTRGTCPFGLAWRGGADAIPTWSFTPPYMPAGVSMPVAVDSDDPCQPMMFTFPGTTAPTTWAPERHKGFQHAGGYLALEAIELCLPSSLPASPALLALAGDMEPRLSLTTGAGYEARLKIGRLEGGSVVLALPMVG